MNPGTIVAGIGGVILLLGAWGLFFPASVMDLVGFSADVKPAQAFGETRAIYGGMMVAMGIYVVLAGLDLENNRRVVFFVALLMAGLAAGRIVGFLFDGFPGLIGSVSLLIEVGTAAVLGWASQIAETGGPERAPEPFQT